MNEDNDIIPTVYVTQENPNLNYVPAEKWGEIKFLTKDDFNSVAGSLRNADLINELRAGVAKFDPENDFVVISGSPPVAAAVFMLLAKRTSKVKLLRWSNRDGVYYPMTLSIERG